MSRRIKASNAIKLRAYGHDDKISVLLSGFSETLGSSMNLIFPSYSYIQYLAMLCASSLPSKTSKHFQGSSSSNSSSSSNICSSSNISSSSSSISSRSSSSGDRCGTVVKVLCYISEGRWFDPSRSHYGPGIDSASNRNEYQHFLGVKEAGA